MEFFNSLNLTQIKGGTKLKQGDFGSVLSYSLTDENGQEITSFDTKTAYINLVLDDKIWFTTTTLVDISRVTFRIDKAIPTGLYYLEIKIDDYIFPSDRDSIILIEEGSTPYDLKELVPNYDINMTIKGILSDLSQKGIDISGLKTKMNAIYNNALADHSEIAKASGEFSSLDDRLDNADSERKENARQLAQKANESDLAVERERINKFTTLAAGSTTGDAELIDARIGANAITYPNVGTAIRKQIGRISSEFSFLKDGYETLNSVFVNGSLADGTLVIAKYRIASSKLMQYTRPVTLAISSGFRIGVHTFDSNGDFVADSGWKTGTYRIDAGVKFKVVIARVAENTNETADVNEFINAALIKTIGRDVADTVNISMVDIKAFLHFTIGGIVTTTGVDYGSQPWRIRSTITSLPYDIEIRKADGYQFLVFTFSDANYTNPVSSGWMQADGLSFTVPKNTYFRILALRTGYDDSRYTITNITTSDVFNNIFVYRADGIAIELENKLNNIENELNNKDVSQHANQCIISISHQGYSTTSQYYGNSRLSSYLGSYLHGFECAEVDIVWSSDGVPVCCHDATFIDTHDNSTVITIAEHTVDELKTYGYYGETIATLDEVVSTCKTYGLKLELDKVSSAWTDIQWQRVFDIVTKYQMQEFIIWTAPNTICATKILTYDKWATIMINANASTMNSSIALAKSIATDYNKIIIACNYVGLSVDDLITYNAQIPERNIGIGVWTIDDAETYLKYLPYSVCITSNKICAKDVMPKSQ